MSKKTAITFFVLAGIANVVGNLMEYPDLVKYSKPVLMPLLLYYVYESSKGNVTPRILFLTGAIVFSWAGDLALMMGENYFLLGVGLFFLAQVIYISLFWRACYEPLTLKIGPLVPYVIYGFILLYVLLPSAGDLQIPILIYGLSLLTMASFARLRMGHTNSRSFNYVAIGAILFLISDSILAVDKFVNAVPMARVLIMSTYIAAQYLIAEGILSHSSRHR